MNVSSPVWNICPWRRIEWGNHQTCLLVPVDSKYTEHNKMQDEVEISLIVRPIKTRIPLDLLASNLIGELGRTTGNVPSFVFWFKLSESTIKAKIQFPGKIN